MAAVGLALVAALLLGLLDFACGRRARRTHPLVINLVIAGVSLAVVLPIALLLGGSAPSAGQTWHAARTGLAEALAGVVLFAALASAPMSLVAPVIAAAAIVPFGAGLIAGDTLQPVQVIAIAGGTAGLIAVTTTRNPVAQLRGRGLWLALVAMVLVGLALVAVDAANDVPWLWFLVFERGAMLLACGIAVVLVGSGRAGAKVDRELVGIALVSLMGLATVYAATHAGELAVVGVVISLCPAVTVGLAAAFLRERISLQQWIGGVGILASVAVLSAAS
jgi:drug/metabolite transporter (DMT)-like permease